MKISIKLFLFLLLTNTIILSQESAIIFRFADANKLSIICNTQLKKVQNIFLYEYYLFNSGNSEQAAEDFFFLRKAIIDSLCGPEKWYYRSNSLNDNNKVFWAALDSLMFIFPGQSKGGFALYSKGLPTITKFHSTGYTPIPVLAEEPDSVENDNIFENSFKGITIAPQTPVQLNNSNDHINFIDTLSLFNIKSAEIGWIKNMLTKDKYANYLTNAKTALQQNDIVIARTNLQSILRDVDIDSTGAITSEAYALLRYNTEYLLSKLPDPNPKVKLINSFGSKLTGGSLQYYENGWKDAVNNNDGTFTVPTALKTISLKMNYAYGSQQKSNVTVSTDTIVFQTVNAQVKLLDSKEAILDTGRVQYYSNGGRDFGITANGAVRKELLSGTYTFKMNYAFASLDKQQNIETNPVVEFRTKAVNVKLNNSLGNPLDVGTVQYYSNGWRNFGLTTNGVAVKELLPVNYTFKMNYGFASIDKQQNVSTNPVVEFSTALVNVKLNNSLGEALDVGTVQYYSNGWRDFGTTTNGTAVKELLPINYTFKMNYGFASMDKQQNVSTNPVVEFSTTLVNVKLSNSLGEPLDVGTVQYYSNGWRDFGTTVNGIAEKELLPVNYTFRMNFGSASVDKQQNLSQNNGVVFQTVNALVQLKDSQGNPLDAGTVEYYSNGWRSFGTTQNGNAQKELLPASYTFRMTHAFVSNDKVQVIGTNNTITFSTTLCSVNVRDAQNQPVNNASVSYYSNGWRAIGTTVNGLITKELLPANLTFRAVSGSKQLDKTQNIGTNNNVEINLP